MSQLVSSFEPVKLGKQDYLFFLVTWNEYETAVKEALKKNRDAFGADLGLKATVVQAYGKREYSAFGEVQNKKWPQAIEERFNVEQDPFMLLINRDFKTFEPHEHPWSIIWFSGFFDNPEKIPRFLAGLARKVEADEDLFDYLKSLERKEGLQKLVDHVEIKPGIYGVSVDIKAILADLFG